MEQGSARYSVLAGRWVSCFNETWLSVQRALRGSMLRGRISGATRGVGQQRRLPPGRIGGSRGAATLRAASLAALSAAAPRCDAACRLADAPPGEKLLATSLRLLRRAPRQPRSHFVELRQGRDPRLRRLQQRRTRLRSRRLRSLIRRRQSGEASGGDLCTEGRVRGRP